MDKPTCTIAECDRPSRARGWCWPHYQQWRRTGAPEVLTLEQKFWQYVQKGADCWEWVGPPNGHGYGRFQHGGQTYVAHRLSYSIAKGEIPAGADIDHICHNTACVRPDHLRAASRKQNAEHRLGAQRNSSTGIRGVYFDSQRQGFLGVLGHHGKRICVGRFDTIDEAEAAVIAKRNELFTHNDADRISAHGQH